jgi:hypothetical protein
MFRPPPSPNGLPLRKTRVRCLERFPQSRPQERGRHPATRSSRPGLFALSPQGSQPQPREEPGVGNSGLPGANPVRPSSSDTLPISIQAHPRPSSSRRTILPSRARALPGCCPMQEPRGCCDLLGSPSIEIRIPPLHNRRFNHCFKILLPRRLKTECLYRAEMRSGPLSKREVNRYVKALISAHPRGS